MFLVMLMMSLMLIEAVRCEGVMSATRPSGANLFQREHQREN